MNTYPYKYTWNKKFAKFPIITYNKKIVWLNFYYEKKVFYDWPPQKVQSKVNYTVNEGMLAMIETQQA